MNESAYILRDVNLLLWCVGVKSVDVETEMILMEFLRISYASQVSKNEVAAILLINYLNFIESRDER